MILSQRTNCEVIVRFFSPFIEKKMFKIKLNIKPVLKPTRQFEDIKDSKCDTLIGVADLGQVN